MGFESVPCPLCGSLPRHVVVRAADRLSARDAGAAGPDTDTAREPAAVRLFAVVRCERCGLAFTDPRPAPETMSAYYPELYHGASGHSPLAALEERYRRRQHREAVRWLRRRRPRRGVLLDVGCGAGDLLCALRDDGWEVRGVEPAPAGVAAARRRGLSVELGRFDGPLDVTGGVEAPGAADEQRPARGGAGRAGGAAAPEPGERGGRPAYDVVVFSGVLEHLHDPLAALRRARGLLAPGGLVAVLHVPLFDSAEARVFGARWLALDLPRHLTHFETRTVPRFAAAAGLTVVSSEEYSRRHSAATLVSSLAPSLQKHRFYLDEGRRPAGLQLARKATWLAAVTVARAPTRLAAAAGCGNHRSYFLAPAGR